MPRVVIAGSGHQRLTGGKTEFEVAADTFGRLIRELDSRYPGLGREIEDGMAVVIDGTVCQDAYATPLPAEGEIYLIPRIAGGFARGRRT